VYNIVLFVLRTFRVPTFDTEFIGNRVGETGKRIIFVFLYLSWIKKKKKTCLQLGLPLHGVYEIPTIPVQKNERLLGDNRAPFVHVEYYSNLLRS